MAKPMQRQLRSNLCIVVLGKQGQGKSLLARAIFAREVLDDLRDHYISISTKPDHVQPLPPTSGPNLEINLAKLGFKHLQLTPEDPVERLNLEKVLDKNPKLCITIAGLNPEQTRIVMNHVGKVGLKLGSMVVLVDEADRLIPRHHATPEEMLNLTRQGRFKGVDLIFVSHNDTSIHPEIVQEANMVVAFGMKHPTRIERLRHFFDDPRILSSLQRYEYVVAYDQTGEICMCNSTEDLRALKEEAPHIFAEAG